MTIDLKAIKERCEKATPAPWDWERDKDGTAYSLRSPKAIKYSKDIITTDAGFYGPIHADQEFIANARADLPALVDWIERAKPLLQQAKDYYPWAEQQIGQLLDEVSE